MKIYISGKFNPNGIIRPQEQSFINFLANTLISGYNAAAKHSNELQIEVCKSLESCDTRRGYKFYLDPQKWIKKGSKEIVISLRDEYFDKLYTDQDVFNETGNVLKTVGLSLFKITSDVYIDIPIESL